MSVRLLLGDSLKIMPRLAEEGTVIDHAIFDPPYEDHMHNSKSGCRGIRTDGGRPLEALDFESITSIRAPVTQLIRGLCRGWFVCFCTPEGVAAWRDELEAAKARYKRACVWVKPDSAPQFNGQGPGMGAEMIVTAWMGSGVSRWNGGGRRGVFEHPCNPADRGRNADGSALHPSEKPLALMMELVNLFTNPGDTVLDPFMGSGSTGVACVKLGRNFIGIERKLSYFQSAVKRIESALAQPDMFIPRPDNGPDLLTFGENECLPKSNSPSAPTASSRSAGKTIRAGSGTSACSKRSRTIR